MDSHLGDTTWLSPDLRVGPLWVGKWSCFHGSTASDASYFADPAYTVASFGLLGPLLGMVQSVVLGLDSVEHNVVVESDPYFVGTGTA